MNWTELLKAEVESTYAVTQRLLDQVGDETLDWKPASGRNWMTVGQLLKHLTQGCGIAFRGFLTGDWGLPEGQDIQEMSAEEQIPPAEILPTIESVAEAKRLLREDAELALAMLTGGCEDQLAHKPAPAPWDSSQMVLGRRLLQMVDHQKQHKGQLFYYLKLMGKPVATPDLWGS